MIGDNTVYSLNSSAVGDLIAAAPSVKYAIDNFHKTGNYLVAMHFDFKEIYHFVPEDKIIELSSVYPKNYLIRYLNSPSPGSAICKLTPSRVKLTQYGSINLLGRVLDDHNARYIPFKPVDVSKYNVEFEKTAILITTYRDKQRTILPNELLKIAEFLHANGVTPVYVGRRGKIANWQKHLAESDFEYPGFGIDLRDQTSLSELASIMSKSKVIIGVDGGPIHVGFTTNTPVICGFTTVNSKYRIPYRGLVKTIAISPNIACNFCESDWSLNAWDFNKCPRKLELADCVVKMDSNKFIDAIISLNIFN